MIRYPIERERWNNKTNLKENKNGVELINVNQSPIKKPFKNIVKTTLSSKR